MFNFALFYCTQKVCFIKVPSETLKKLRGEVMGPPKYKKNGSSSGYRYRYQGIGGTLVMLNSTQIKLKLKLELSLAKVTKCRENISFSFSKILRGDADIFKRGLIACGSGARLHTR